MVPCDTFSRTVNSLIYLMPPAARAWSTHTSAALDGMSEMKFVLWKLNLELWKFREISKEYFMPTRIYFKKIFLAMIFKENFIYHI